MKFHFLLVSLNVVYVLAISKPREREDETLTETRARQKLEQDDYLCKGHICNATYNLFDEYHNKATTKEIWDSIEAKFLLEDATSKKLLASKFFFIKWLIVDM